MKHRQCYRRKIITVNDKPFNAALYRKAKERLTKKKVSDQPESSILFAAQKMMDSKIHKTARL